MDTIPAQGKPNSLIRHLQEHPDYSLRLIEVMNDIVRSDRDRDSQRLSFTYVMVPYVFITEARALLDIPQITDHLCSKYATACTVPADSSLL